MFEKKIFKHQLLQRKLNFKFTKLNLHTNPKIIGDKHHVTKKKRYQKLQ